MSMGNSENNFLIRNVNIELWFLGKLSFNEIDVLR